MAELPPKIPSMTQNWSNAFLPHQRMDTFITTTAQQQHHQQHQQPCWDDEFLDFTSARRWAHRRSVSDSIAFLESPLVMMEDQECRRHNNNNNNNIMHGFERLDDEQLIMSMFSDDMSLSAAAGAVAGEGVLPAVSSSNPSTPSDQNSNNDGIKPTMALHQPHDQQPKTEPGEVESPCEGDPHAPPPQPLSTDSVIDPKRVKRILANRQSAQRSRVRKLQYISELEHSVTTLQSEVSALSPRVAFLDHHRLILNVDNSALKQRIAALAQDKIFKDAHQEALKKEIERLRQVYHQQNLKKKNMQQQQQQQGINQNSHPPPPSTDQQISDIALATTCAGKEQISIHS